MRLVGRLGAVFQTSLTLALSWLTYLALTCSTCLADRGGTIKPVSVSTKVTERHPDTQWQTRNDTACACVESKSRGSVLTCLFVEPPWAQSTMLGDMQTSPTSACTTLHCDQRREHCLHSTYEQFHDSSSTSLGTTSLTCPSPVTCLMKLLPNWIGRGNHHYISSR
jgi:hypothetical protein